VLSKPANVNGYRHQIDEKIACAAINKTNEKNQLLEI
jgi:hypothetical protein